MVRNGGIVHVVFEVATLVGSTTLKLTRIVVYHKRRIRYYHLQYQEQRVYAGQQSPLAV